MMRRISFSLILFGLVLCVAEFLAWLTVQGLVHLHVMAYIPTFPPNETVGFFTGRHPSPGWLPNQADWNDPQMPFPCISAYGDSFTRGRDADTSYPGFLARLLGGHVANFGVGGYGSDQALMLWREQRDRDRAPLVILGHFTENILRNVNQYRNLLYPGAEWVFKPRFLIGFEPLFDPGPQPIPGRITGLGRQGGQDQPGVLLALLPQRQQRALDLPARFLKRRAPTTPARTRLGRKGLQGPNARGPGGPKGAARVRVEPLGWLQGEGRGTGGCGRLGGGNFKRNSER